VDDAGCVDAHEDVNGGGEKLAKVAANWYPYSIDILSFLAAGVAWNARGSQSRAVLGAAKRSLEGEDRSKTADQKERMAKPGPPKMARSFTASDTKTCSATSLSITMLHMASMRTQCLAGESGVGRGD
jgi:hypothetical protein